MSDKSPVIITPRLKALTAMDTVYAMECQIATFFGWRHLRMERDVEGVAVFENFWWPPKRKEPSLAAEVEEHCAIRPPRVFSSLHDAALIEALIPAMGPAIEELYGKCLERSVGCDKEPRGLAIVRAGCATAEQRGAALWALVAELKGRAALDLKDMERFDDSIV
jgi:hypothetical protein